MKTNQSARRPLILLRCALVLGLTAFPATQAAIEVIQANGSGISLNGSGTNLITPPGGPFRIDIGSEGGVRNGFDTDGDADNGVLVAFFQSLPVVTPVAYVGNTDLPSSSMPYFDSVTAVNGAAPGINYLTMSESFGPGAVVNVLVKYDFGPTVDDGSDDRVLFYAIEDDGGEIDLAEGIAAIDAAAEPVATYQNRDQWIASGGSAVVTEDFESFVSDTFWNINPLELAGEQRIRLVGTDPDPTLNLVFPYDGSGGTPTQPVTDTNYAAAGLSGDTPGNTVVINLCQPVSAWGAEFLGIEYQVEFGIRLYSGDNLVATLDPTHNWTFFGFIADPGIPVDRIEFFTTDITTNSFSFDDIAMVTLPVTKFEFVADLQGGFVGDPLPGTVNEALKNGNITQLTGTFSYATEQNVLIDNGTSSRYGHGCLRLDQLELLPDSIGDVIVQNFQEFFDRLNQFRGWDNNQTLSLSLFDDDGTLFPAQDLPGDLPLGAFESAQLSFRDYTGSGESEITNTEFFYAFSSFEQIEGPQVGKNARLAIHRDGANIVLTPTDLPSGLNFHLEESGDLADFAPPEAGSDFTSESADPVIKPLGLQDFYRLQYGTTPGEIPQ
ncbi:hypothetical protein [Haloferula sp.]|uniref:hypothetical protein n=1 Tax=Haloferula sp. TaxID=2497595 RepID=UPI00329EBCE1